ncbi:hypothetical protein LSH36_806g01000 [Paralvinella palmiformis]|uniref:Palmitoyltransferase n=1 Tax=Paralvinella palmiformis TaxID=53620 RepID=A0AAD9IZN6_9ANNE|nr:hypothetical protein LSH36_806g01000 [Paralvinella palmiformis]
MTSYWFLFHNHVDFSQNPEAVGGLDPRIELIAQRVQQLHQMMVGQGGHGHSHTVGVGEDPANLMIQQVLLRMHTFIQKQAEGTYPDSNPSNQEKACQVLEMIKQVEASIDMPMPTGDDSISVGHTGLEGLPLNGVAQQMDSHLPPDPVRTAKQKLALMAGDISTNAPHRQKGWIRYPEGNSEGPIDSFLYGGGHFTPPVFGWGELVKEEDSSIQKAKFCSVQKDSYKTSKFLLPHETSSSGRVIQKTLPLVGRVRFLTDWQGMLSWTIVVIYWCLGNYSTWFCILLPQYADGNLSSIWLIVYAIVSALCITSHLKASMINPGKVPYYVSKDSTDHPDWTYCEQCEQKRPPRAHHCRRCQQCVLKMDHHCPWINNCVGEGNQWAFILLIIYAQLLSSFSLAFNILWYWYMPACVSCDPMSFAIFHQQFFIGLVSGMAVVMIIFSVTLICSQNMGIMVDFTTLEWMNLERQVATSGKMPDEKDMPKVRGSIFRKYRQLCGDTLCIFWPFPCRQRIPPVRKDTEDV